MLPRLFIDFLREKLVFGFVWGKKALSPILNRETRLALIWVEKIGSIWSHYFWEKMFCQIWSPCYLHNASHCCHMYYIYIYLNI
jgi:hypothetical protein